MNTLLRYLLAIVSTSLVLALRLEAGTFGLSFDGVNDYVTFGPAPGLGAASFTLETWFKRTGAGATASTGTGGVTAVPLVTKGRGEADGTSQDMNYFLGIRASDNVLVADFEEGATGTTPGLNHPVAGVTPILNNLWYHAAVTYDGATWRLYLNGVLETTLTIGQPPRADSIQHAALASALTSTGAAAGFFAGLLDEVRIWNYARSAADIAANRDVEIVAAPGLIGRWGLEEGTGTLAGDTSGSGINGTLVNGPLWVAGYPFGGPNQSPAVVITSPANNAVFTAPATIVINADATDNDGSVSKVEFFQGTTKLGEDLTSPYSFTWNNVPAGAYTLTARATDNGGLIATSAPVNVTVQNVTPTVTRGPYLQLVTPASIVICWRTDLSSDSRVRYGLDPANLDQTAMSPASVTNHLITLSGLTPDTKYYYAIGTSTADLASGATYFFFTAPAAGTAQPMRFWILGDAGTGTTSQANVRNAYYNFTGSRYTDLVLMLGDNAYDSGTDTEYQSKVFNLYPTILRQSALFSTIGNHDTAQLTNPDINTTPYFLIFTLPTAAEGGGVASGTEKYYSFNYANVHFVCLDSMTSDRSPTGPMLTWVQSDLAQNTADWLIAYWHHPPYSKGSHNSDTETALIEMRQNALPILEAYGVDMVLAGHSHSYERSFLLDGHYGLSTTLTAQMILDAGSGRDNTTDGAYQKPNTGPNSHEGAVYVVSGSAGQTSGGTLNHPAMYISLNQLGSFVLDIDGQRLDAKFITDTGLTNDYFTVLKGPLTNNPPSVSITSPANGAAFAEPASITITATAVDSDGTVASVAFYENGNLLGTDTSAPFSFSWNGVAAGSYTLVAVATDNLGAQAQSAPVTITVNPPSIPAAPSGLSAVPLAKRKIQLTWTDNSANESGFKIERSTDSVTWSQIATVGANTTSYTNNGLKNGVTYYYRVRAYNASGDSGYSNIASATAHP